MIGTINMIDSLLLLASVDTTAQVMLARVW